MGLNFMECFSLGLAVFTCWIYYKHHIALPRLIRKEYKRMTKMEGKK